MRYPHEWTGPDYCEHCEGHDYEYGGRVDAECPGRLRARIESLEAENAELRARLYASGYGNDAPELPEGWVWGHTKGGCND